ncbi:MAG: sulfatase-like hydrolase/transferase, partial [Planctomycetota bacterium]
MRAGNAPVTAVIQRLALAAAGFALVMAAIWGIEPDGAPSSVRRVPRRRQQPNVVLIIIEAMAPAHCSLYGYERDTTPFLRELAAECVVFDEAYAASSWTRPSVASIFTGLYPSQHGALEIKDRLSP